MCLASTCLAISEEGAVVTSVGILQYELALLCECMKGAEGGKRVRRREGEL